jgi:hypothetical protein
LIQQNDASICGRGGLKSNDFLQTGIRLIKGELFMHKVSGRHIKDFCEPQSNWVGHCVDAEGARPKLMVPGGSKEKFFE